MLIGSPFFFPKQIFQLLHLLSFSLSPPLILGRTGELKCATAALRGSCLYRAPVPGFGLVQTPECLLWKSGARFKEFVR